MGHITSDESHVLFNIWFAWIVARGSALIPSSCEKAWMQNDKIESKNHKSGALKGEI